MVNIAAAIYHACVGKNNERKRRQDINEEKWGKTRIGRGNERNISQLYITSHTTGPGNNLNNQKN
jgi:hypothetical protein